MAQFSDRITSEAQMRDIIGYPNDIISKTKLTALDDYCRDLIAHAPLVLIASYDAQGSVDVSPKGDPPGFVHVLDDRTLLIPDRPGNRRADTFTNILQNPKVGLLFLIPGKGETLRVSGQASLIRDADLRQQMAVQGKVPKLLIAVSVEEAFFHCPKCILRSDLWGAEPLDGVEALPSLAHVAVKYGGLNMPVETLQTMLDEEDQAGLY